MLLVCEMGEARRATRLLWRSSPGSHAAVCSRPCAVAEQPWPCVCPTSHTAPPAIVAFQSRPYSQSLYRPAMSTGAMASASSHHPTFLTRQGARAGCPRLRVLAGPAGHASWPALRGPVPSPPRARAIPSAGPCHPLRSGPCHPLRSGPCSLRRGMLLTCDETRDAEWRSMLLLARMLLWRSSPGPHAAVAKQPWPACCCGEAALARMLLWRSSPGPHAAVVRISPGSYGALCLLLNPCTQQGPCEQRVAGLAQSSRSSVLKITELQDAVKLAVCS
jgi:hypothetical protein